MSAPVRFMSRTASEPENTSPFAITGMSRAAFTSRMTHQSAFPE